MTGSALVVADAGEAAGLGHISRASALAVAMRCRGIEARCFAYGATEPFDRDGIDWTPLGGGPKPDSLDDVLVVDSYRLDPDELAAQTGIALLVVLHDFGTAPQKATLVVSAAAEPTIGDHGRLSGFAFAALRPAYWGLPRRVLQDPVGQVLVTTGGGQLNEIGSELAQALVEAVPGVGVALVRGPHAEFAIPPGVELIDAPDSLLGPLLAVDLVVSAAGQTMLEAAACGTPCVALPLVENQRRQALRLAANGAVRIVSPPRTDDVIAAVHDLVDDAGARRELSRHGQETIDGCGALRVAFHIQCLLRENRSSVNSNL